MLEGCLRCGTEEPRHSKILLRLGKLHLRGSCKLLCIHPQVACRCFDRKRRLRLWCPKERRHGMLSIERGQRTSGCVSRCRCRLCSRMIRTSLGRCGHLRKVERSLESVPLQRRRRPTKGLLWTSFSGAWYSHECTAKLKELAVPLVFYKRKFETKSPPIFLSHT